MLGNVLLLACIVSVAGAAGAQEVALSERGPRFLLASRSRQAIVEIDPAKAPVFQRRVSLDLEDATVGQALAAVSRQAGIRLVYSRDVLDPGAPARIKAEGITVAGALTEILLDTGVDVVLSDLNRVTLAPRNFPAPQPTGAVVGRVTNAQSSEAIEGAEVFLQGTQWRMLTGSDGQYRLAEVDTGTYVANVRRIGYRRQSQAVSVVAGQESTINFVLTPETTKLDELVVTGTIIPTEVKAVPTPVTVISAEDIAQRRPETVQELFRHAVPGAVSWDIAQSPYQTSWSVRGTSSFVAGPGQLKVLVDGIEVAHPQFASVDPNSVERIEVIRGPQAAAIYGSDAIGGVIQIFTKRGDPSLTRPQVSAEMALGILETPYPGFKDVLKHSYSASIRGGGPDVVYGLGAGYSHLDDYLPDDEVSRQYGPSVFGGVRFARGMVSVDVSGRYLVQNSSTSLNPEVLQSGFVPFSRPRFAPVKVQNQTVGAQLTLTPHRHWVNMLTLGLHRYAQDITQSRPRFTTPGDTLLLVSNTDRTKSSVGFSSSLQQPISRAVSGTLTVGFEHWRLPINEFVTTGALTTSGAIQTAPNRPFSGRRSVTTNTGYFTQAQLSFRDAVFLTAGLRAEDNSDFGDALGTPVSPRVGISYVETLGRTALKLRGSYGSAIRPPAPGLKLGFVSPTSAVLANPDLGPERQKGWDVGVDAVLGGRSSLSFTYYDQTADDLIQDVRVATDPVLTTQWQNVGRVHNSGIEVEGTLTIGSLALKAQYGYARSRVSELSATYAGTLAVGDQPELTPRHTAGASISFAPVTGTTISGGLTYVGRFTAFNSLAFFRCLGETGPCEATDREYVDAFPGFVKLNAMVSHDVTAFLSTFITADNLTNSRAQEFFTLVPTTGRITTAGLRLRY